MRETTRERIIQAAAGAGPAGLVAGGEAQPTADPFSGADSGALPVQETALVPLETMLTTNATLARLYGIERTSRQLCAQVLQFGELLALLESLAAETPVPDADPREVAEWEAAVTWTEAQLTTLQAQIQDMAPVAAPDLHWLVCEQKSRAAEAEEIARRAAAWKRSQTGLSERLRRQVALIVDAVGGRLSGGWGQLRVQANGGALPITHDGETPIPAELLAPVLVDPVVLIRLARLAGKDLPRLAGDDLQAVADYALLGVYAIPNTTIVPDLRKVAAYIKEHGEVPEGFAVGERGFHLRVE